MILTVIFYMNKFNKRHMVSKFEEITKAEGITIQSLLKVSGIHLSEQGHRRLTSYLEQLNKNPSIFYIGLFENDDLIYLRSRFEGYFPVVPGQSGYRFLDTPVGKIFEITSRFDTVVTNVPYRLHIGFDYNFLDTFEKSAERNFLVIAGFFTLVMLLLIALVVYFDRKFFQKELELVQERQEKERLQELSLLTSEIAHEIKNPLNSIYLSFNVLDKYCSNQPEAIFYRDAVKSEIKRVSDILQAYSELSREIKPEYRELTPGRIAAEFKLLMEAEVNAREIDLRVEVEGDEDRVFKSDWNLLKQILLNLVKNSMEAEANVIIVTFSVIDNTLRLQVADNGSGVDEKIRYFIFKPYTSGKTKGTGLGLHITLRLVKVLNGEIKLVSYTPGNTVFRVTIGI